LGATRLVPPTQAGLGLVALEAPPLRVIEDFGVVGGGVSGGHHVRCENGQEYLLKGRAFSPDNPYVAANELIAARLARCLDLPVLGAEVARLKDQLFFASPWMDRHFFGNFGPDALSGCLNRERVYDIAVFDAWICNSDRHEGNLLVRHAPTGADVLLLNDHSHCLSMACGGPKGLTTMVTHNVESYIVSPTLWDALTDQARLDEAITRLEVLSVTAIRAVVDSVPAEFLTSAERTACVEFLVARQASLRQLFAKSDLLVIHRVRRGRSGARAGRSS
jgi:hypothetical protein